MEEFAARLSPLTKFAIIIGFFVLLPKGVDQSGARMVILLAIVAVCSKAAPLIHLEEIVGAFLAGFAAKRAVCRKFIAERLEVVARARYSSRHSS